LGPGRKLPEIIGQAVDGQAQAAREAARAARRAGPPRVIFFSHLKKPEATKAARADMGTNFSPKASRRGGLSRPLRKQNLRRKVPRARLNAASQ